MNYMYGGFSKVGFGREINEDFVHVVELGEKVLLAVVTDGAGSRPSELQPAQIAARNITDFFKRVSETHKDDSFILDNGTLLLNEAVRSANSILGAFRTANEEVYSGFSCACTCLLLGTDSQGVDRMSYAHIGNTRLYLIRRNNEGNASIRQLTTDQTAAQKLLEDKQITEDQYYYIPERNQLLCPLGMFSSPQIDLFSGKIKKEGFFLLTTDGIHYAIRPEGLATIVLENDNLDNAAEMLCNAAEAEKYNDDYAAILIRCV